MQLLKRMMILMVALFVAAPRLAAASGGPFGFTAPAGWLDLSPAAPPSNFARVSPELASQAKNKDLIFFAADVDHVPTDGFLTNVNATLVSDKPVKVTKETLDEVVTAMGAGYVVHDKSVMDVGGISVGRIIGELTIDGGEPVTQAAYVLPGKQGAALLTFSTTKERLAHDQASFDASARATVGLYEPGSSDIPRWVFGAATGAAVAIGLAIHGALQRRSHRRVWESIQPVLHNGPATLQELAEAAGMTGFMSRGKVVLCLQEMTGQGRLDVLPAPDGTPQLQKVNHVRYSLRA